MSILLICALLFSFAPASDTFAVRTDLQALYDDIDQATLSFLTPSDVDQFNAVAYTPDWTFIDASGRTHSAEEMRQAAIDGLKNPADWRSETIRRISSLNGNTAVVLVDATIVRKTTAETTPYRDTWVRRGDSWKMSMREQIGASRTSPYKPSY